MYLLYLDESGTHPSSTVFVLGGIAVHESDAFGLQGALTGVVRQVAPRGVPLYSVELHAGELKEPRRVRWQAARRGRVAVSPWEAVRANARFWAMHETYRQIASYRPRHMTNPVTVFVAVVEKSFADYEERAYEELLHRFDEFLTRRAHVAQIDVHELGLVVHDRHEATERSVQGWTGRWRNLAGRIGRLTHLADVPFFADSKATRLLQAADFISWAAWRYYEPGERRWLEHLWPVIDGNGGTMHGLAHVHRGYAGGACACPGCLTRALPSR